jgi:hypothetical protein
VGHVKSHFGPFGDTVGHMQDRCIVCAKHTIGPEIVLDALDSTPRLRSSSGCLFSSFDIVLILTQDRCKVCAEVPQVQKSFWTHQMVLLGDEAQVDADSVHLI